MGPDSSCGSQSSHLQHSWKPAPRGAEILQHPARGAQGLCQPKELLKVVGLESRAGGQDLSKDTENRLNFKFDLSGWGGKGWM